MKESKVYISSICGLCSGATSAINKTKELLKSTNNVVLYKELLHNSTVIKNLENNGAIVKNNLKDIKKDEYVVIRGHGEAPETFEYLNKNEIKYLDCTCPNVKAIQLLVKEKDNIGYKIIIIGKHGNYKETMHPEVYATSKWCNNPIIIENEDDIKNIDLSYGKYYLVSQTTFNKDKASEYINIINKIMIKNNKIFECKNTICNAQKAINESSIKLANDVDIMIVIGGRNSSNSKELYKSLLKVKQTLFIEKPKDIIYFIRSNILDKNQKIGITAGASTMKEDILKLKEIIEKSLYN